MESWIVWAVQGVIGLALGLIIYFLKRLINQLEAETARIEKAFREGLQRVENNAKEDVGRVEKRVDTLEAKFERLPLDYATKEEFIRVSTGLDNKMDKILDKISALQMKRGE